MADTKPSNSSNVVSLITRLPEGTAARSRLQSVDPQQLELTLDGDRKLMLVATEKLHGATFLRTLLGLQPRAILDLRFAPHFEFVAVPGREVISRIKALGVPYVLCSVPFHEIRTSLLRHGPAELADRIIAQAFHGRRVRGPLMILVQHAADAEAFGPYIVAALERADRGRWAVGFLR